MHTLYIMCVRLSLQLLPVRHYVDEMGVRTRYCIKGNYASLVAFPLFCYPSTWPCAFVYNEASEKSIAYMERWITLYNIYDVRSV